MGQESSLHQNEDREFSFQKSVLTTDRKNTMYNFENLQCIVDSCYIKAI